MVCQIHGNSGADFNPHIHTLIAEGCFNPEVFFRPNEAIACPGGL